MIQSIKIFFIQINCIYGLDHLNNCAIKQDDKGILINCKFKFWFYDSFCILIKSN